MACALALPPVARAQTTAQTPAPAPGQAPAQAPAPAQASAPASAPAPAQNRAFITQSYVDTTVMRALYVLNEATAQYSMSNNRQGSAVNQAKAILENLKQKAKNDPNERYALMKIQEVEAQIYLEEEEMRRIAEDKRILTANQLIVQYNAEVGKMRPDFATLRALFRRMAEVDTRQANNLADNYNKRYRQISREAMYSLEKALNSNDFDLAKRELEYCEKNKNHLMINSTQLASQRERLERIQGAHTDLPKVVSALDDGEKAYREFHLSESRTSLTLAHKRIDEIRSHIPVKDGSAIAARADRAIKALDAREDSLVKIAINVLEKQGADAATEYFNEVLQKKMQISQERASFIDQAIMRTRPDKGLALESKVKMVEHVEDETNNYEMITSIQDKARFRAQEKADSVRMVRDKAANISINVYTLLENRRPKDAARLFGKEKNFLASVMDKNAFDMLQQSVNSGAAKADVVTIDKNKRKAEEYTAKIYTLLEKNAIKEAHQRFQKYRKPLSKYLDRETFQMLELTVTQSYNYSVSKK